MTSIGPYNLDNCVALAPMAGVTDLPFRKLCRELGAGLVVSEMVTSDSRLWHSRKTKLRLHHSVECEPRSVQIAGSEPAMMAQAAAHNAALGAQIIDINMGCPAKKVCRKAAGSALLQDEALVKDILTAVIAAVDVPVTLKLRTGWSPRHRNGPTIAGVMIGRSAQGRPWLCGQIADYLANGEISAEPSTDKQWQIMRRHLTDLHQFYGEYIGVRVARKHIGWYLGEHPGTRLLRRDFNSLESAQQQLGLLENYFNLTAHREMAA